MNWFRRKSGKTEHQRIGEQLSAYLDNELTAQEHKAVERHLATCEDCRWDLNTLRQTVQWTQALPTLPLPRVFTIPASVEPARARRQSWRVPVLQGATALVALLLVFAFVGDFALTGVLPGGAPRPLAVMEQQAVEVMDTQPVAAEIEATVLLEVEAASLPAGEEAAAEKAVAAAPAPPDVEAPSEAVIQEEASPPPETQEPGERALGAAGFETPTEAPAAAAVNGKEAREAPLPLAGTNVAETEGAEAYSVEVTPTREAPTLVAKLDERSGLGAEDQVEQDSRGTSIQDYGWLRTTEVVLGSLFIALAAITAVVMVWRRQAR